MRRQFSTAAALLLLATLAGCADGSGPDYGGGTGVFTTLAITPADPVLFSAAPNRTVTLTLAARDDRGQALSGGTAEFTSDNPAVATVDGAGLVTAVTPGTARITASLTLGGVTRTRETLVTVRVPPAAAAVAAPNLAFEPGIIDVAAGGEVTWTNSAILHTVTFETVGAPADIGEFRNGTVARTFSASGNFTYHCAIHPSMTGVVRVHEAATSAGFGTRP